MNPEVPKQLKLYLDEIARRLWSNKATVMVGAGFSQNAKSVINKSASFPNWQELGNVFYEKLYDEKPSEENNYLSLLKLAEQVEVMIGRTGLDDLLRKSIQDLNYQPSKLHTKLLDLPWKDVFTTNYDTLLERARDSVIFKHYEVVKTKDDLLYANKPRIVKLHGSFPSPPFTITEEDYRRYPNDYAPFVNTVRQSLLENTLCLIGFSGNDPNFLQWIGWIRDHIGKETMSKIYWIGFSDKNQSEAKLLDKLGITVVDLSMIDGNKETKLKKFLEYLKNRKYQAKDWPAVSESELFSKSELKPEDYAEICEIWRGQREKYPGWVVVPENRRSVLLSCTLELLNRFSQKSPLEVCQFNTLLDLDLAYELGWRLDHCLVPLIENVPELLEHVVEKYRGTKFNLPKRTNWTKKTIDEAVIDIQLWLLRYYREVGQDKDWFNLSQLIKGRYEILSPEHQAKFHLEEAFQAIFQFKPDKAKQLLVNWKSNNIPPFWKAKRSALLAELGENEIEQYSTLEKCLSDIRQQLKLNPITNDYTIVSQESVVMLLLWAVKCSIYKRELGPEDYLNFQNVLSERWDELVRFKCNPRYELRLLSLSLEQPSVNLNYRSINHLFNLGKKSITYRYGITDTKTISAYGMLRIYEDFGFPYRINNITLVKAPGESVVSQVRHYTPHWALVNIVRLGNAGSVKRLFDREYLHKMEREKVDELVEIYLSALEYAISIINKPDSQNFIYFERLAKTLLEVCSRLCFKCSPKYRERLASILPRIYSSKRRQLFGKVSKFVRRLFKSMSIDERVCSVPLLLEISSPDDLGQYEKRFFVNPIQMIKLPLSLQGNEINFSEKQIDVMIDKLVCHEEVRNWTLTSLVWLYERDMLNHEQSKQLETALWKGLEHSKTPEVLGYHKFKCISLPHPITIKPDHRLKQYLLKSFINGSIHDCYLDELQISAKFIQWSESDILKFVNIILEWWKKNRYLFNEKMHVHYYDHYAPLIEQSRKTIEKAIYALSALFLCRSLVEDEYNNESFDVLRNLITNLDAHNIPISTLEVAIFNPFHDKFEHLVHLLSKGMLSRKIDIVMDSLLASKYLARKLADVDKQLDFDLVAKRIVEGIQWRCHPYLAKRLRIAGDLIIKQHWQPCSDSLVCMLDGLAQIKEETSSGNLGNEENDLIQVRAKAAYLASVLHRTYLKNKQDIPEIINCWQNLCQNPNEFSEIKNAWDIVAYKG